MEERSRGGAHIVTAPYMMDVCTALFSQSFCQK